MESIKRTKKAYLIKMPDRARTVCVIKNESGLTKDSALTD
jgi:hypothetical protein